MSNRKIIDEGQDGVKCLTEIENKLLLNDGHPMARSGSFMEIRDLVYMSNILSRPITVVYKIPGTEDIAHDTYGLDSFSELKYKNPFVIYRIGGHFVPLIQPKNHNEGLIEFAATGFE